MRDKIGRARRRGARERETVRATVDRERVVVGSHRLWQIVEGARGTARIATLVPRSDGKANERRERARRRGKEERVRTSERESEGE